MSKSIFKKWKRYHKENPHIWEAFEAKALEAVKRKRRFGAKAIFEILRWETSVSANNDPFKLSNYYTAYYARLFAVRHPAHRNFFKLRNIGMRLTKFEGL